MWVPRGKSRSSPAACLFARAKKRIALIAAAALTEPSHRRRTSSALQAAAVPHPSCRAGAPPPPSGSRPARHLLPQRRHECSESEEEARHDAYGDGETAVMRWKSRVGRSSFVEDAPKRENTAICTLVREGACFAQSIAWVAGCQNSVKLYVFCTYGG
jgi:hypothetical protein